MKKHLPDKEPGERRETPRPEAAEAKPRKPAPPPVIEDDEDVDLWENVPV
jgi:hypothetical protein